MRVVQYSQFGKHRTVVTDAGLVFVWHFGEHEEGHPAQPGFVRVAGIPSITEVCESDLHHLAIDNEGTVWSWGANHFGQLGRPVLFSDFLPRQVGGQQGLLHGIQRVRCNQKFSFALSQEGQFWLWGDDIGRAHSFKVEHPLVDIQCSEHDLFGLDTDGRVWGWKLSGIWRTNGKTDAAPELIQDGGVVEIRANSSFLAALTEEGQYQFLRSKNPEEVAYWKKGKVGGIALQGIDNLYLLVDAPPDNVLEVDTEGHLIAILSLPQSLADLVFARNSGHSDIPVFLDSIREIRGRQLLL